jgi:hypothetical protein
MKKLNQDELQTIASFIQKRGFTYIDVQTELLDHVACRVEEIMDEDPEVTLDAAIQKTHSEFGIFGFSAVEDGVIAGLTKKYNRFFWSTFLSFLGPKYILLVLLSGYFLYKVQAFLNSNTGMYILAGATLITAIVYLIKSYRSEYKQYLAYRLSTAYFIGLGSFYSLMMLIIKERESLSIAGMNIGFAMFSAFILCFCIYVMSAVQTAKQGMQAAEEIRQKYQCLTS